MLGKKEEDMEATADMGGSSVETKSSRTPATSSAASPPPTASAPAPTAVCEPSEPADDYGTALLSFSTSTQTLSSIDPFSTIPEWETGKRYQEMFDRARKDADEVYKKLLDYMDKRANEKRGTGGEKGGKGEEEKVAKSEASIAQPSSPSSEPPKSDDAPSTDSKTTCEPSACPSSPPAGNEATEEKTEKKDKGKQGVTDKPKTEDTTAAAPAAPTEPTTLSIDGEEKKGKQAESKEKK